MSPASSPSSSSSSEGNKSPKRASTSPLLVAMEPKTAGTASPGEVWVTGELDSVETA
ncbi:hypothetical protein F444_04317 [Phytophthora nicotianae P1976]|uniref:Uncharacterized protein n=1 Tax=Phytophthora nicotianae P1976 TaxID=1317066 RepID=A0A081AR50_PHYNI|nr:hypothetical protein F444_04317 [Phytophthora nicotianae P1976]